MPERAGYRVAIGNRSPVKPITFGALSLNGCARRALTGQGARQDAPEALRTRLNAF